jgi:hypothetical protein
MSVLLQNPHRIFASILASDSFNNSVIMEKRHLEETTQFDPKEMFDLQHKLTLQQRVDYVQKLPREGNVVHNNLTFRTHYADAKSSTALFLVDKIVVVFLDKDNPSIKKPMGTINSPSEMLDKIPPLESIKKTMYAFSATRGAMLAVLLGASIAGSFLIRVLSFEDKSMQRIQGVFRVGLTAVAFLAGWRLVQWALFINKLFFIQNLGSYVALIRGYAYSYPELVSEHHLIQNFLLSNEIAYLKRSPSSVVMRLKNNLSL